MSEDGPNADRPQAGRYRVGAEVAGGLGERTVLDRSVFPPRVEKLEYALDDWLGSHLIESFPVYLVSDQLAEIISSAGLRGTRFKPALITISAEGDELIDRSEFPQFRWLEIDGEPNDDFSTADDGRLVVSARARDLMRPLTHGCEYLPLNADHTND